MMRRRCTAGHLGLLLFLLGSCRSSTTAGESFSALTPLSTEQLATMDAPGYAEARARLVERAESAKQTRMAELVRVRKQRNERTLARHDQLVRAGGYERSLAERISRIQSQTPTSPGAEKRSIDLVALLQGELERLRCAHPEVFLVETEGTSMQVFPASYLIITGCRFGVRDGQVNMRFKEEGPDTALVVRNWDENTILVEVPDVVGVVDQKVLLTVTTFQGHTSAEFAADFVSTKDVQVVFGHFLAWWPGTTHDENWFKYPLPECVATSPGGLNPVRTVRNSLLGFHYQHGDLYATAAVDTFRLRLIHQWKLTDFLVEYSGWSTAIAEEGNVTNYSWVLVNTPDTPTGEQPVNLYVYWWVDHSNSSVLYTGTVLIEGPRGATYAVIDDDLKNQEGETSAEQWQRYVAEGLLPGTPCP